MQIPLEMLFTLLLNVMTVTCNANKEFDICYINLDTEVVRNMHMRNLFAVSNCSFTRFNAVNGVEVLAGKRKIDEYIRPHNLNISIYMPQYINIGPHFHGMIGCKLSHYLNLRRIEKTNSSKPVLVLEDDVDLEVDFIKRIETALRTAPKNWDLISVTEHFVKSYNVGNNTEFLSAADWFIECIFLVNGANSARKVANLIESQCRSDTPIDNFLGRQSQCKTIQVYGFNEKVAVQMRDSFKSTIPNSWPLNSKPLKNSLSSFIQKSLNN